MRPSSYFNQKGLTLVEVLIASGLVVTLLMGVGSYMQGQHRFARNLEQKVATTEVFGEITKALSDEATCKRNFETRPVSAAFDLAQIVDRTGTRALHRVGQVYGLHNSVELQSMAYLGNYVEAAPGSGTVTLKVRTRKRGVSIGGADQEKDLILEVKVNASNEITSCSVGTLGSGGGNLTTLDCKDGPTRTMARVVFDADTQRWGCCSISTTVTLVTIAGGAVQDTRTAENYPGHEVRLLTMHDGSKNRCSGMHYSGAKTWCHNDYHDDTDSAGYNINGPGRKIVMTPETTTTLDSGINNYSISATVGGYTCQWQN